MISNSINSIHFYEYITQYLILLYIVNDAVYNNITFANKVLWTTINNHDYIFIKLRDYNYLLLLGHCYGQKLIVFFNLL